MFGTTRAGDTVLKFTIGTGDLVVSILNLGAILQDVRLRGVPYALTLGSDDLQAYEGPMKYFGALVGPVANRIASAKALFHGENLNFTANEPNGNVLHGGTDGTHSQLWELVEQGPDHLEFCLSLPDGLAQFPGNRQLTLRYETGQNSLTMHITGVSDANTLMNLANHSFWNLDGDPLTDDHKLWVAADRYTPVDDNQIPTGIDPVAGTSFDFQTTRPVGSGSPDRIDHNLCLTGGKTCMRHVATLTGGSGIRLMISTTEAGLQVYDSSGGGSGEFPGHINVPYGRLSGIALEAQGWPDAPNQPQFPSVGLGVGETYEQKTRWGFEKS